MGRVEGRWNWLVEAGRPGQEDSFVQEDKVEDTLEVEDKTLLAQKYEDIRTHKTAVAAGVRTDRHSRNSVKQCTEATVELQ